MLRQELHRVRASLFGVQRAQRRQGRVLPELYPKGRQVVRQAGSTVRDRQNGMRRRKLTHFIYHDWIYILV